MFEHGNINDDLKRLLNEMTVQPEPASFEAIVRKMERKKRRRFFIFFWLGLGLISTSFCLYYEWKGFGQNSISEKIIIGPVMTEALREPLPEPAVKKDKATTLLIKNIEEAAARAPKSAVFSKSPIPSAINSSLTFKGGNAGRGTENTESNEQTIIFSGRIGDSEHDRNQSETGTDTLKNNEEEPFVFLQPETIFLKDSFSYELMPGPTRRLPSDFFGGKDSLHAKRVSFYLGLNYTPQLGSFLYLKNPHRNPVYDKANSNFPKLYYQDKKNNNRIYLDDGYGLKAGMLFRDRYELLVGFGFQRYHELEKTNKASPPTNTLNPTQNGYFPQSGAGGDTYLHTYRYRYYLAEVSRIYNTRSFYKHKLGAGVQLNQLRYDVYNRPGLSTLFCTVHFKTGLVANAGKRLQFQLCQAVFCAPGSMFARDYVIQQKPYGFQLEALLLFRIF